MIANERTEVFAGMRELLDWLEANPVIPLSALSITQYGAIYYPRNSSEGQELPGALGELRKVGDAIGVELTCPYGRHVHVNGPKFRGGVTFDAIVCDAEQLFRQQEAERTNDVTQGEGEVGASSAVEAPTAPDDQCPGLPLPVGDAVPRCGTFAAHQPHRLGESVVYR